MYILGISAYYHDAAAALICNDEIIAAAQEERFTRIKHDETFPKNAINFCLSFANITLDEVDYIAFYDKPFLKFERLLETYLSEAPFGFKSFMMAMPIWIKEKLFLKETLARNLAEISKCSKKDIMKKLMFGEHHFSHAASAFYPSPYFEAAILTVDGVGEWASASIAYGNNNKIEFIKEINFPHSLGLLYSAFTYYCGFKVNSGEYKLMGLAPYGKPKYVELIKENLIDIKDDGSFWLDMSYFNYTTGLTMTGSKFNNLFGGKPRAPESRLTQFHMDLAASIQVITEEIMLNMASYAKKLTGSNNLCMAGGVALNCVSNGKIHDAKIFENIWIQPSAGDAGGSLGAAFSVYYQELNNKRNIENISSDAMHGSYLGPCIIDKETIAYLDSINAKYTCYENESELLDIVTDKIINNAVVGWSYGRMEFGPRALGNRSILGNPLSKDMQSIINLKIKFRESFRPFAPAVLSEFVGKWFQFTDSSPYMLFVSQVGYDIRKPITDSDKYTGMELLLLDRSKIPSVTHVDYTSRLQTVDNDTNSRFYKLIKAFYNKTGCPMLINTSFNVRGEPIVCTAEDSYRCFMRTDMDVLVIGNVLLYKPDQPPYSDTVEWQKEYKLD